MSSSGGLSRRRAGRPSRRSTFIEPRAAEAREYRRKHRKGWANWQ